ncbi:MAG: sulfate reduction electron transfer complex DsrMKJOP subunit DsrM [Syntrophales bacterium]|nr:sulfate reduction electron transfer complex DsrMKJOP subunit DsrM [Syntrophales bacterium]
MNIVYSLALTVALGLIAFGAAKSAGLSFILVAALPYAAFALFLSGFIYRIVVWAKSPVPFRIPTTCGQENSLPWIKASPLDNPSTTGGVIVRMFLEIFFFRSLFRNIRMDMTEDRPVYGSAKWLWFFGLMFHWTLLLIVIRHLRFFLEPVPWLINGLSSVDGFFEIGIPTLYLTDTAVLLALSFLILRRIIIPEWRYISLLQDYFALFLIFGIIGTGLWMRHIDPVDLLQVKALVLSWPSFSPVVPKDAGIIFYIHLFLVLVLVAWFPFGKLMHMPGVFLSPTRNLCNDSRANRHINPWDRSVKVHSYEEYEDEFRDKMKAAGLPVEKE